MNKLSSPSSARLAVLAVFFINGLLLATWDEMDKNAAYSVRLQASLDIEALPLPLRPLAYVSPSWHLSSEWYTWDLDL